MALFCLRAVGLSKRAYLDKTNAVVKHKRSSWGNSGLNFKHCYVLLVTNIHSLIRSMVSFPHPDLSYLAPQSFSISSECVMTYCHHVTVACFFPKKSIPSQLTLHLGFLPVRKGVCGSVEVQTPASQQNSSTF